MSNVMSDKTMTQPERMVMEKCLTQNFLLKFGMDIFGKRDLLFIDMRGDKDVASMYSMEQRVPEARKVPKPEKAAKADADEDAGDDDAGDDDE